MPGYGAKANITVTIDLEDLKAATASAVGDLVYGDGLSAAAIRRLACDARIIPLVLGSNSEPLDVGRSERLVTRAMRKALNARDKGCVVCGAPPIQCDAHHLISWIDGGETSISNLALLCRRHHVDLHDGRWTITITNGQVTVARPQWATPPPIQSGGATTHRPPTRRIPSPNADPCADPAPPAAPARQTRANPWDRANSPDRASAWDGANAPDRANFPDCASASDRASEPAAQRGWWWADDATRENAARFALLGTGPGRASGVLNAELARAGADPPSFATI